MPGARKRTKGPYRSADTDRPAPATAGRHTAPGHASTVNTWLSTFDSFHQVLAWTESHDYRLAVGDPQRQELATAWARVHEAAVGTEAGRTREDCELTISRRKTGVIRLGLQPHTFVMDEQGKWFDPAKGYYPRHLNED